MAVTSLLGTSNSKLGDFLLARTIPTIILTTGNSLVLSQSVSPGAQDYEIPAASAITFSQTTRGFSGTKLVLQALPLVDVATVLTQYNRSSSNALSFVQSADAVRLNLAANVITFGQTTSADKFKGTNDVIVFSQIVTSSYNPHYEHVNQPFLIIQSVLAPRELPRPATNSFVIGQSAVVTRVRFATASNVFAPHDTAAPIKVLRPSNMFVITGTVAQFRVINRSIGNILNLTHSVVKQMVFNFSINHQLVFGTHYNREIQIGNDSEIVTLPNVIVTKPSNIVVLKVPQQAVTLESPEMGDSEGTLGKVIKQRTINGTLHTYVRRSEFRKLRYSFEISRAKMEELRFYVTAHMSDTMELTNWKGEIWRGFLVNNPFDFRSKGRSMPCDGETFNIDIEFEGVKIHG